MAAEREYLAGFFDGDGGVRLSHPHKGTDNPIPVVSVYQSCNTGIPPELELFRQQYPGSYISERKDRKTTTSRRSWELHVAVKSEVTDFLDLVKQHGIVKTPQASIALGYLAMRAVQRHSRVGRITSAATCEILQEAKGSVSTIEINRDRLTLPYLAGLFAAEGYVGIRSKRNTLTAVISQSKCPRLLRAIREKLGYGSAGSKKLEFSCRDAIKFLTAVRPFIRKSQKECQIDVVLAHFLAYPPAIGRNRTAEEKDKIQDIKSKLSEMKRM